MSDEIHQQEIAARIEKDFYYNNIELLHKMITMLPARSGLLFGLPYYIRTGDKHSLQFMKVSYGHLYGPQLHTRSKLLSLIAREEPHFQIVAEDDTGRMIYGSDGQAVIQRPASDSDWNKYMSTITHWNKVRDRIDTIIRGTDISNPAGIVL